MSTKDKNIKDYISPLEVDGLKGRILRLPAPKGKTRHILFIYGQHSSIERWWGITQNINQYGSVAMPDLPGFGGMDSLYRVGKKPTMDNLADWLADFVRQEYPADQKLTIMGMSLGFAVTTRMLQRHPELVRQVEFLVSVVGLTCTSDFAFSHRRLSIYKYMSKVFAGRFASKAFRAVLLQPRVLRLFYHRTFNAKEKFADVKDDDQFEKSMNMEIGLWQMNDIRTQFQTYLEMFALDNTHQRIDLSVWHVATKKDRYFNNDQVEKHMRQIFNDFHLAISEAPNHAPTVVATAEGAAPFIPPIVRDLLSGK